MKSLTVEKAPAAYTVATPPKKRKIPAPVGIAFFLIFFLAMAMICYIQSNQTQKEKQQMERIAQNICSEVHESMLSQFSKTQVLEAYLIENNGDCSGFDEIAEILLKEKYVRNVLFAPDGKVTAVYPLLGNESVIGLDMRSAGAGNKEAQSAIDKKQLYLAGPFSLVQGGMGIAGRLPVFLKDKEGREYFWGVVSVTLEYPDALAVSSMDHLSHQGFACEIWRINPDDGARQRILCSNVSMPRGQATVDYPFNLFNSNWTVSIAPLTAWYARQTLWLEVCAALAAALLAAFAEFNAEKVRQLKAEEAHRQIVELHRQLEVEKTNMLLSQISSHFFYHTLNSLQALIVMQPETAYKMAGDFSRYLRFNVDSITAANGIGSFHEEIRAVRAYVDISRQQLGERLRVVYHLQDEDFAIPVLTIEPVVENALLHGIRPKVGGGTLTVSLESGENEYLVTVEDDGVGFDPSVAFDERSIGLANVRRRLSQFPGCGIRIDSKPGVGTKIVLIYQKNLHKEN